MGIWVFMKRCSTCKNEKSFEQFSKHAVKKDGYRSCCKQCTQAKDKFYRANNPEINKKKSISLAGRFRKSKWVSLKRKISWSLTKEEYSKYLELPCYYCRNKLGQQVTYGCGLDRIDSSRGYEPGNIVSCCWQCNTIKSDILSFDETKAVISLVLEMRQIKKDPQHSLAEGPDR